MKEVGAMKLARGSVTSVCLAFFIAACGTGGGTGTQQGGSGGGSTDKGGSGGSQGGSGGNQGGSGGNQGGSGGNQGGSGGNQGGSGGNQGGSGGNQGGSGGGQGGSGGNQGGSGGNQGGSGGGQGGSGGTVKGGSGGGQGGSGGGQGGSGGGSGGTVKGGSGGGQGGSGGGQGGTGGGQGGASGGNTGSGGTSGAGGSTPTGPAVYTSTNGSCVSGSAITWTPGTISTSTANATVTVNDTASQTWEGFGGCFNERGWQALQQLGQSDRDRAMQLLFAKDAANFAIGRIPMGASDYAIARYTDDEGGTDTAMANFNTTQDEKYLIPYIKAALAVKSDIKFWASPWTPPTWMKTGPFTATTHDNATTSSNFDSGNMNDVAANLTAYAQYFVKFVAAYKAAGINITTVAPQNEPNYALHYPSCIWTTALFTKFVGQYLGPALKDAGVGVMVGTLSNADSGKDTDLGTSALNDSTAGSFFKVAGVQWNVLEKVIGGTTFKSLPIWATEHKCGNYPWDGATGCGDGGSTSCPAYNKSQAPNDQAYGVESWYQIRRSLNSGRITAYNAWNMALDTGGLGNDDKREWRQNALLAVDTGSKALKVTPAYCVFRHFSQFVAIGAKRVATSGGDAVAFKNPDGSIVAVMYNSGSANSSYGISIGGQKFQFSMPAAGWATVVFKS
jgi:glucosylceramidase